MDQHLRLTILHADDNEAMRYLVHHILQDAGFTVQTVATGAEALQAAQAQPALIILDVRLPDINGFEVCQWLKAMPRTARIPVLHLSAVHSAWQDRVRGLEGGADGYLVSPAEPAELVATVRALVRTRQDDPTLARRVETPMGTLRRNSAHPFQQLLDALPVAVYIVDTTERVVMCNQAWATMTGYTVDEMMDTSSRLFYVPEAASALRAHRRRACAVQAVPPALETTLLRNDGRQVPVELVMRSLRADSRVVGWVGLVQACPDRQQRPQGNAELEDFTSQAAHDLQEPVQTTRMFLTLLQRHLTPWSDTEAHDLLGVALRELGGMEQLIDAVLTYARVGQPGMTVTRTASAQVLSHAIMALQGRITAQHAVITHDSLPLVQGNATHLSRVFQNLLSNALTFRGAQSPRIHVSARREDDTWVFAVQDNGIGIAPTDTRRIFVPFHRLHPRQAYAGTGLGLTICQRIIEAHGGRIWVDSQPGQGTTVFFTLPERAQPPARAARPTSHTRDPRGARALRRTRTSAEKRTDAEKASE